MEPNLPIFAGREQPIFELVPPDLHNLEHAQCTQQGLFGGSAFFVGGGRKNYPFPPTDALVARALAQSDAPDFQLGDVAQTKQGFRINLRVLSKLDPSIFPMPRMIHFMKADPPRKIVSDERRIAHDLANVMVDGLFTQPVYAFFAPDFKTLREDKPLLPREYWEIADSLAHELDSAQQQVVRALPLVMAGLQKRYPQASTGQLYQGALQLIGNELAPILATVQMWTTGFRQALDPKLKDTLKLVRAIIESNLFLALTGNLKLDQIGSHDQIKQLIPTINVSVGDVVLPVLIGPFDSGPAVIPIPDGALGPRGGHLAFLPWNLIDVLPLIISIYMHEAGHLLQSVIVKFMETYAKLAADTIASGVRDGTLVFDEPFVMIGAQQVPAEQFWTMVFIGQLPELDADHWGMRGSGAAAFIRCFINYLGAMTEVAFGNMDRVKYVLRMGSSYTVVQIGDGKVGIRLEPHPQDGPRIGSWQAAIAELMGFPHEAGYAIDYAASESGPDAQRITWTGELPRGARSEQGDDQGDDQGILGALIALAFKKGKQLLASLQQPLELPTISASVKDYDKVARLVAAAFFDTRTDCLNGLSLSELVCLTPAQEAAKVDPIKLLLKQGVGQLPADGKHHFFHTIGSAAECALSELVSEGVDPKLARERVVPAAMSMMLELLPQWEADVARLDIYKLTPDEVQPDAG